ncbi:gas vesicle protein GvpH [Natrinema longum]|uniref:Hsp20/alpha crystallin family protein n=1 Tax=Natrinema longum TaxID=370324 RepID=A0A8A2U619_9EURY|nr:gas vesicle protein GvpH [Natrinema longum]MBZ6494608.1 hypothetical protein [Natrinema longum]QSW84073.1 hypothetical protein J0X27_11460 [Natrinema longum]
MTDDDRGTDRETDRHTDRENDHDGDEQASAPLEGLRRLLETLDDLEAGERRDGSRRIDGHGVSVDGEYELSIGFGDRFERRTNAADSETTGRAAPRSSTVADDAYHVGLVEYDDETLLVADLPGVDAEDVAVRRGDGLEVVVDGEVIERVDHAGRPSRRRFHNGLLTVVVDGGEQGD